MDSIDTSLPLLGRLIEQRLALVRSLAESLELSSLALAQNDAEAIARGAAHQAELCRQWERLENQLRRELARRSALPPAQPSGKSLSAKSLSDKSSSDKSPAAERSARLQAEWDALSIRIRYLTRVHCSLLRHLQRSLAVMNRVVDSCALTYTPDPRWLRTAMRNEVRLVSGE
jgi:hypothetical protein